MSHKRLFAFLALPAVLFTLQAQPASAADTLRCESKNHKPNTCNVAARGRFRADIVQQTSKSKCLRGRTWGESESGVWVDQGCSGVFRVSYGGGFNRDHRGPDMRDHRGNDWHDGPDHHDDHDNRWHDNHHDDHH